MTRIVILPEALREFDEAVDYVAEQNPRAAVQMAERVMTVLARLAEGAFEGRSVRLGGEKQAHRWPVPPLLIYYVSRPDELVILRIFHARRRPIGE